MEWSRDFKGIWIPKEIWLSKDLTLQEKVFLVEIDSLDNEGGCYAWNKYFSEFFEISKTRVSLVIKSLIDKWYITSEIIYKEGTKEILKRVINVCYRPPLRKVKDPIKEKLKDNNTFNNTTNNTFNKDIILQNNFSYKIAEKFLEAHIENNTPGVLYKLKIQPREKILEDLVEGIEKLKKIDKYNEKEIDFIINFLISDNKNNKPGKKFYWLDQIQTTNKLREKNKEKTPYFVVLIDPAKQDYLSNKTSWTLEI